MIELNFKQEDKARIEGEKFHSYHYYEFTEQSLRALAARDIYEIPSKECYQLVQMLYPSNLICSGLFERCLVFDIINGIRQDPPKEHWYDLATPGSNGILLERIITALEENGVEVHQSWKMALNLSKVAKNEQS